MTHLTLVRGDDWEGIYIDGKLITEGHSHDTAETLKLAIKHKVMSVDTKWAEMDWLAEVGNLPQKLSDVKLQA